MEAGDVPLHEEGLLQLGATEIEIIDPVRDYADLMEEIFDFDAIRRLFAEKGFTMAYDAMHAVTGPYAREIFVNRLGVPESSLFRCHPLPDFGSIHPDPNLTHAKDLVELMYSTNAPDFGAASDGDGDRNMILGRHFFVTPSDSVAILAANAHLIKGYNNGLAGVARSMPTSRALDEVARALKIPCYETPTGWKFFGNLLDDGRITICGEESFGTGSNHVREKDGLWAVLFWLNILAMRQKGVAEIVEGHWIQYGRHYYTRHDYEGLHKDVAEGLMESLRTRLASLKGKVFAGEKITDCDDFAYEDPVDGTRVERQGIRIFLKSNGRIIYRLSGTGTEGATLRVYIERLERNQERMAEDPQAYLQTLIYAADQIASISATTGRKGPSVIT